MSVSAASRNRRWFAATAGIGWVCAIVVGVLLLMRFQMTPGPAAAAAIHWPGGNTLPLSRDADTLILFMHPQCACSTASVEELNRLMCDAGRAGDRLSVYVLMHTSSDASDDITQTALGRSVSAIAGVIARADVDGAMAKRFDARTSGQAFLYDPAGRLLFSGGITGSRGHAGDNAGVDAVLALIHQQHAGAASPARTAVFGCPLDVKTNPPAASQPTERQ